MSLEEQISTHIAAVMDRAGVSPISIPFVPEHSQVDAYLASLRSAPAQGMVTVSPGAIAPDAMAGFGSPGAVAPNSAPAAGFGQAPGDLDEIVDSAASNEGKPADISFANSVRFRSMNLERQPDAIDEWNHHQEASRPERLTQPAIGSPPIGELFDHENDIKRGSEQAALGICESPLISEDRKSALADQPSRGGIVQEQTLSQNILRNLQPEELDSINQQATSGPGTADASEAMRKVADDIAEMRTLLGNGVNTAEIIKQLLQALKAM